jgi:uroporphyrinogen-III synthase
MRVLITRPQADAMELSAELVRRGHDVISEPLLQIAILPGADTPTDSLQGLVLTSANGARAAAARIRNRTLKAFAVGPTTAAELRANGFTNISVSTGNGVPDLVKHITAEARADEGPLLHVTSAHTAGDLSGTLARHGFQVRILEAYTSTAADQLSAETAAALSAGRIDAAMFFSPRTAGTFSALIQAAGLAAHCKSITALALSENVAKSLHPLIFRKLLVAETTGTGAMLDLLKAV